MLAVAGLAVHRPVPAEQRPGRAGPPRLGVPRRRPHPPPPVRIWLAHRLVRHAARDVVSVESLASRSSTCRIRTASTSSNRPPGGWPTRRGSRSCSPPASSRRTAPTRATATTPPTPTAVVVPDYLPDTDEIRQDLAEFYGSITVADAAVGQLLDTLAATGLDRSTWVVFMTDHGPALPRAKSTLYDAGTGIAMIVRPPRGRGHRPRVYDDLFSGVDLVPTLLDLLGVDIPPRSTGCRTPPICETDRPNNPCGPRSTPPRPITIPSTRFARSGPRNTATSRTTRRDHCSTCRGISPTARPAGRSPRRWRATAGARTLRPPRRPRGVAQPAGPEVTDKAEAIANDLALLLNDWRQKTNDVIPSEFAGTRISGTLHRNLSTHPRPARHQPVGDRSRTRHRRRPQSQ